MSFTIPPKQRRNHLYRCGACGAEIWYAIELPEHLLNHREPYRRCDGRLELVRSAPSLRLIPVEPIGEHETLAHINRASQPHTWERVTVKDYPPSPRGEELRKARVGAGVHLGELARRLGLRPSELSDLERGRATLSEEDWAAAMAAVNVEANDASC